MPFDSSPDKPAVKEIKSLHDLQQAAGKDNLDSSRLADSQHHQTVPTISAETAAATKRLEESKTIPPLTIDSSKNEKKDWTVAIHLAASLPGTPEQPTGWGVDHQLTQLKTIAKETEGTSVSYIIHADRPLDAHGKPCVDGGNAEKIAGCVTTATDKNKTTTERYFAHDGKLDRLPDAHFKSPDADISSLLKEAQKLAPSDKLELVLQSHGMGADGLHTNQGDVSLKRLTKDIAAGLKGSGRDKLDLLDFDSCNMAEAKALEASKKVAKDVVASSSEELTSLKGDGQNISAAIQVLAANSKLTGVELGNNIVNLARSGKDGDGDDNGTPTLANFDLSKHDDFKAKLDHLGNVLADSIKGNDQFRTLLNTIDKVSVPETSEHETEKHNRDLKDFAQNMLDDAKSGKLKMNATQIEQAAKQFLDSYNSFATNQFGDKSAGYDKTGGMTVFLPSSEILDSQRMTHLASPLYDLDKTMTENTDPKQKIELDDRPLIQEKLGPAHDALSQMWSHQGIAQRKEIDSAWSSMEMAKNSDDMARAYKRFQDLTHSYEFGPVGKTTEAKMTPFVKRAQKDILRRPQEEVTPGWDRFIKTMEGQAK